MIKNVVLFTVHDPNRSGFDQHKSLMNHCVTKVVRDRTGRAVRVRRLGESAPAKGAASSLVRTFVEVVETGSADGDREAGSAVGILLASPRFTDLMNACLLAETGLSGSILSHSTSLDTAIDQTPPGLIIQAPGPSFLELVELASSPGAVFYNVLTGSDLADGQEASVTFEVNDSILTLPFGGSNRFVGMVLESLPFPSLRKFRLTSQKAFSGSGDAEVDGTWTTEMNYDAKTVSILRDGVVPASLFTVGSVGSLTSGVSAAQHGWQSVQRIRPTSQTFSISAGLVGPFGGNFGKGVHRNPPVVPIPTDPALCGIHLLGQGATIPAGTAVGLLNLTTFIVSP